MKYKILSAISISLLLGSNVALASSGSISTTGPNSANSISENTNVTSTVTNVNNVTVNNTNNQTAKTGNATVSHNTTAGSAVSGAASNSNTTSTTINVNNVSGGCGCLGPLGGGGGAGGGPSGGGGGGAAPVSEPGHGAQPVTPLSNIRGAGGAAVGAVKTLPSTGPNDQIDVSSLRDSFPTFTNDTSQVIHNPAVKKATKVSGGLIALATLLSLITAVGGVYYVNKRKVVQ